MGKESESTEQLSRPESELLKWQASGGTYLKLKEMTKEPSQIFLKKEIYKELQWQILSDTPQAAASKLLWYCSPVVVQLLEEESQKGREITPELTQDAMVSAYLGIENWARQFRKRDPRFAVRRQIQKDLKIGLPPTARKRYVRLTESLLVVPKAEQIEPEPLHEAASQPPPTPKAHPAPEPPPAKEKEPEKTWSIGHLFNRLRSIARQNLPPLELQELPAAIQIPPVWYEYLYGDRPFRSLRQRWHELLYVDNKSINILHTTETHLSNNQAFLGIQYADTITPLTEVIRQSRYEKRPHLWTIDLYRLLTTRPPLPAQLLIDGSIIILALTCKESIRLTKADQIPTPEEFQKIWMNKYSLAINGPFFKWLLGDEYTAPFESDSNHPKPDGLDMNVGIAENHNVALYYGNLYDTRPGHSILEKDGLLHRLA